MPIRRTLTAAVALFMAVLTATAGSSARASKLAGGPRKWRKQLHSDVFRTWHEAGAIRAAVLVLSPRSCRGVR